MQKAGQAADPVPSDQTVLAHREHRVIAGLSMGGARP